MQNQQSGKRGAAQSPWLTPQRNNGSPHPGTAAPASRNIQSPRLLVTGLSASLAPGGMGQVFLVQHPRLPRRDALNDDFKARFQREADLLAQLSHPNIVTLHDRGEFEGRLWITMDYIDGTDAAELLKPVGYLLPGVHRFPSARRAAAVRGNLDRIDRCPRT